MKNEDWKPATRAAQALGAIDSATGGVVPSVHVATTYVRNVDYESIDGRTYSRADNPTYQSAEALLASLEGGAAAMCFGSGMAAAAAVIQSLKPGDHVVAPDAMYYGLAKRLREFAVGWGISVDFVPTEDWDALAAAVRPGQTKLVWVETPCNPVWTVTDIATAAEIAHGAGARLAVDSTVATPVLTRPIELGADIVMHSATKYLNGHSDAIAGMLVTAKDDEFWERVGQQRAYGGAVLGPFEAFLLLRGMRTLYLRVNAASRGAQRIAEHLAGHEAVTRVLYPGLPDHPGHDIAKRQMTGGFGGMLSILIRGDAAMARGVATSCRLFKPATSLGGVESLIEHRATVEGEGTRTPDDLLRLSVGIEDPDDLIADLDAALARLQN